MSSRPKVTTDYLIHAQETDIYNHVQTGSVALEDALLTKTPNLCQFTRITGILFSNAYLAHCYVKDKTMSHTNFKKTHSNSLMNYSSANILTRASLEFATETTTSYEIKKMASNVKNYEDSVFIANMVQRESMCKPVTCVSYIACQYAPKKSFDLQYAKKVLKQSKIT